MNIYLISQGVNNNYDTYDCAVVAAPSEDDARMIKPHWDGIKEWDGKSARWDTWCSREDVEVELIGTTEATEPRLVCASFNAG